MSGNLCTTCAELGQPDGSCSCWCRDLTDFRRQRDELREQLGERWQICHEAEYAAMEAYMKAEVLRQEHRRLRRNVNVYRRAFQELVGKCDLSTLLSSGTFKAVEALEGHRWERQA